MGHSLSKADPVSRALAALVDGAIACIPLMIPLLGALVSAAYMLTKDTVVYEITKDPAWKNRSIGKRLFHLEVVSEESPEVDWATSIRRNLPLAIGSIIAIVPIIGWVIGLIVSIPLFFLEVVLVLSDPLGRRLGDRFARTTVAPQS